MNDKVGAQINALMIILQYSDACTELFKNLFWDSVTEKS